MSVQVKNRFPSDWFFENANETVSRSVLIGAKLSGILLLRQTNKWLREGLWKVCDEEGDDDIQDRDRGGGDGSVGRGVGGVSEQREP